ncbi:MAG: HAD hydrolase family protein [Acidobacteria bacterium]|nr:HAD hydrolase family protein [Acidobacteriota bacterium]
MPSTLLISDLDGTWLPAPERTVDLQRLESAVAAAPALHLAFATGRALGPALEALKAVGSQGPRTFVTDVGCALHHPDGAGGWREDADYRAAVERRWDPEAAARVMTRLPEGIRPQPGPAPQRRLALQVAPGFDPVERAAPLAEVLREEGLEARILPSHGFYLDVLPRGVDKGFAVRYLRDLLGIGHVVSCGDSENDLDLFRASDIALLMPGHHLEDGHLVDLSPNPIRCAEPGPDGIFLELKRLGHL